MILSAFMATYTFILETEVQVVSIDRRISHQEISLSESEVRL
jgi:hypothetical protein